MEAGRDLDRLVAEKVMGWWFDTGVDHPVYGRGGLPAWGGFAPGIQGISVVPHYSTDIAAAWQVVDHFSAKGYYTEITDRVSGRVWYVSFGRYAPGTANTAPLAICLAALNAVEIDQ